MEKNALIALINITASRKRNVWNAQMEKHLTYSPIAANMFLSIPIWKQIDGLQ